jgi:hypothetical protein
MLNKHLQEFLKKYPDDIEVVISSFDGYDRTYTSDFGCEIDTLKFATYTSKWQSCMDEYSLDKTSIDYDDFIDGKKCTVSVPTIDKQVLILDV